MEFVRVLQCSFNLDRARDNDAWHISTHLCTPPPRTITWPHKSACLRVVKMRTQQQQPPRRKWLKLWRRSFLLVTYIHVGNEQKSLLCKWKWHCSPCSDANIKSFSGVFPAAPMGAVRILIEHIHSNNKQWIYKYEYTVHFYNCIVGGRSVYPGGGAWKVLSCLWPLIGMRFIGGVFQIPSSGPEDSPLATAALNRIYNGGWGA